LAWIGNLSCVSLLYFSLRLIGDDKYTGRFLFPLYYVHSMGHLQCPPMACSRIVIGRMCFSGNSGTVLGKRYAENCYHVQSKGRFSPLGNDCRNSVLKPTPENGKLSWVLLSFADGTVTGRDFNLSAVVKENFCGDA
jgi:hypothetical protein